MEIALILVFVALMVAIFLVRKKEIEEKDGKATIRGYFKALDEPCPEKRLQNIRDWEKGAYQVAFPRKQKEEREVLGQVIDFQKVANRPCE